MEDNFRNQSEDHSKSNIKEIEENFRKLHQVFRSLKKQIEWNPRESEQGSRSLKVKIEENSGSLKK